VQFLRKVAEGGKAQVRKDCSGSGTCSPTTSLT